MEDSRLAFLNSLNFIIACQIVYMYFLDFNMITLLLHVIQMLIIYHGCKHNPSQRGVTSFQRNLFVCVVIFSNIPVILFHVFYENVSPIVLTFIGSEELHGSRLLLNDAIVMILESFMILNQYFLECH